MTVFPVHLRNVHTITVYSLEPLTFKYMIIFISSLLLKVIKNNAKKPGCIVFYFNPCNWVILIIMFVIRDISQVNINMQGIMFAFLQVNRFILYILFSKEYSIRSSSEVKRPFLLTLNSKFIQNRFSAMCSNLLASQMGCVMEKSFTQT